MTLLSSTNANFWYSVYHTAEADISKPHLGRKMHRIVFLPELYRPIQVYQYGSAASFN